VINIFKTKAGLKPGLYKIRQLVDSKINWRSRL